MATSTDSDPAPRPKVAAVILAAGGGSRFDGAGHKLLADLGGQPVVTHAVGAAVDAGLDMVIVVTGAVDLCGVMPESATVVHNLDWASGQATSVQAGIAAADSAGCDAVVIGLGDQPGVPAEAWRLVAAADFPIAVATYDGHRRNPVRLARAVWPLLPITGDEGARSLIRARSDLVGEVPCHGEPADIDTQEDLDQWN